MSERGFALVTVVLLMVGLAVLAAALGFASAQQAAVRASLHDLARARFAADGAATAAVDDWSAAHRSLDRVGQATPLWTVDLEPDLRVAASVTRLSRDSWLVDARAVVSRAALPPLARRARRLVHALAVDSTVLGFDAALIAGRVDVAAGAAVSGDATGERPAGEPCSAWPTSGAAVRAPAESTFVAPLADVRGSPTSYADPDPARFRDGLGVFDRDALIEAATSVDGDRLSPAPAVIGVACDTAAPGNWGAVDGPCATRYVLAHAPGALTIGGGYGQGVLIASGDLALDGGFVFRGVILAAGTVTVRDAEVHGSIAARNVDLGAGARVTLDRCALAAVLADTPALGRAVVPPRSWLPVFD